MAGIPGVHAGCGDYSGATDSICHIFLCALPILQSYGRTGYGHPAGSQRGNSCKGDHEDQQEKSEPKNADAISPGRTLHIGYSA